MKFRDQVFANMIGAVLTIGLLLAIEYIRGRRLDVPGAR